MELAIEKICRVCYTCIPDLYCLSDILEMGQKSISIHEACEEVLCTKELDDKELNNIEIGIGSKNRKHNEPKQNKIVEKQNTKVDEVKSENTRSQETNLDANEDKETANVELVLGKQTYDLNDVVVLPEEALKVESYNGFLNNLGSEITATFVTNNQSVVVVKPEIDLSNEKVACENRKKVELKKIDRLFKCDECSLWVKTERGLNAHKAAKHGGKPEYRGVCEICGHISTNRSGQNYHRIKHQVKRFQCSECGKLRPTSYSLKIHMISHENKRKFLCSYCGKGFNFDHALTYHMRLHTGEKSYKCSYCNKSFRMPHALKRHINIHTGQRPFCCQICGMAFRSKSELKVHEQTHTGLKSHFCTYCKKGFTKRHYRNLHTLTHSGPSACDLCPGTFVSDFFKEMHKRRMHSKSGEADLDGDLVIAEPELT